MLENFKALSQLKTYLEDLQFSIKEAQEQIAALNKDIGSLREQTQQAVAQRNESRQDHLEFIKASHKEMDQVQELRIKLAREINAFDQVKRELAATLAKRVEAELKTSLVTATEELRSKVMDVKQARDMLESLYGLTAKASESINRLHFIASDIKTKDFDLSKSLETIKRVEAEKLELQQRLERAESYAAKEVRRMSGMRGR
jgi:chromosome segregation ATPase